MPTPPGPQVALLVEGSSQGLSALAAAVCAELNASRQQQPAGAADAPQQQQEAAEGAPAVAAVAAEGGAVTVLVVSNLIRELAVRKSYGLKDGEGWSFLLMDLLFRAASRAALASWLGWVWWV
jgi:hypothetical protein